MCVVGGGPAGLYTAAELVARNIKTTLHERGPEIGGLYRHSLLPASKMAPFARLLENKNLSLQLNSEITPERLRAMERDFDAVVVATGPQGPRRLAIPGGEHAIRALDIARSWTGDGPGHTIGRRVLVVGMGNVSMDIAKFLLGWRGPRFRFPSAALERAREVEDVTITSRSNVRDSAFTNVGLQSLLETPSLCLRWSDAKEMVQDPADKPASGTESEEKPKRWWERRTALLKTIGDGAKRLRLMFSTDVKSIERVGGQYKVRMEQDGTATEECFDTVISSIGFRSAGTDGWGLSKPVYHVGWARHPRGGIEKAKEDAAEVVNKIAAMEKMQMA